MVQCCSRKNICVRRLLGDSYRDRTVSRTQLPPMGEFKVKTCKVLVFCRSFPVSFWKQNREASFSRTAHQKFSLAILWVPFGAGQHIKGSHWLSCEFHSGLHSHWEPAWAQCVPWLPPAFSPPPSALKWAKRREKDVTLVTGCPLSPREEFF